MLGVQRSGGKVCNEGIRPDGDRDQQGFRDWKRMEQASNKRIKKNERFQGKDEENIPAVQENSSKINN